VELKVKTQVKEEEMPLKIFLLWGKTQICSFKSNT
jgi:hypothetical protein